MKRSAEEIDTNNTKDVCLHFFKNVSDDEWKCICGTTRKQTKGHGYTNLWNHIATSHPDYKALIEKEKQGVPLESFLHKKESNLFGWLGIT